MTLPSSNQGMEQLEDSSSLGGWAALKRGIEWTAHSLILGHPGWLWQGCQALLGEDVQILSQVLPLPNLTQHRGRTTTSCHGQTWTAVQLELTCQISLIP